jgi:hypothetical protein
MRLISLRIIIACLVICSTVGSAQQNGTLASKIKRFAPTTITGNVSKLSKGDKQALDKLVQAAKLMDSLYLRQVWSGNIDLWNRLQMDNSTEGKEQAHYFRINMGPWSKLDQDEPFIAGVPKAKPLGANYYPEDMTKEEFDGWAKTLPESLHQQATGFFYTIHRNEDRRLYAEPYSKEYGSFLSTAAQLLNEAASLTENASLKDFLTKRAAAFLSNDYYDSDVAWMKLDSPIEPTIGPYEVYMDELYNYKAAFEAFITLRNDDETKKLTKYSSYLQEIENNLPIDAKYRNPKIGALSPIRVVDEVLVGGEARAGVQTAAFNLPNDEKITGVMGSKRVMLKNVQEAKFNSVLKPIAKVALGKKQQGMIAFEPFFTHILAHELMHGLGPHTITVNGKETTARKEMKELGSALEEAKADISGLFALQFLIDKGVIGKSFEKKMYTTFLASSFRSIRFGTNDAHGKGMALQCNYLLDEGGFAVDEKNGTFSVNFEKIKGAVRKLTGAIMTLQAEGNYDGAKKLLDTYGVVRPAMQNVLDKLKNVPTDIEPRFPLAKNK